MKFEGDVGVVEGCSCNDGRKNYLKVFLSNNIFGTSYETSLKYS